MWGKDTYGKFWVGGLVGGGGEGGAGVFESMINAECFLPFEP